MRTLTALIFVGVSIQFSVAITAKQLPMSSPTLELVSRGDGGLLAIIEERSTTTTTPFKTQLPQNRCGSLADCKLFGTEASISSDSYAEAAAHPFQRIWLVRVDSRNRPLADVYQTDSTYKLLSVAECGGPRGACPEPAPPVAPGPSTPGCGPTGICPQPAPTPVAPGPSTPGCGPTGICPQPAPTPVAPGPSSPGCGPTGICPQPGPGRAFASKLDSGQLVVTEEHSLSKDQREYLRRLLSDTQKPTVQESPPR
jgi:hypothetical protein